jgi:LmbE family N-acetylglucosaminyl deacetylase
VASPQSWPRLRSPDDESAVSSYLAKAIFDQGKRVAIVYGTRGDGGGNTVGPEQAASLGLVREIEARTAVATLGIDHVWFLDGRDTPSQDVLQSLETWHHGAALEQAVRLVRLTRPDVIMTWLPQFVIGENHGDHQAAGVIATEAFDLAGDPSAYPSQVAPPRDRTGVGNLTEGLTVWQPKKLYYFSDRAENAAFQGKGPSYPSTETSPAKKVPYYQLTAKLLSFHRTQGDEARISDEAVRSGDYTKVLELLESFSGTAATDLILGKSLVGGSPTGDALENVTQASAPAGSHSVRPSTDAVELGGPWRFYRAFWQAHGLESVGRLFSPELGLSPGRTIRLPLVIRNGPMGRRLTLAVAAPRGWTAVTPLEFSLGANQTIDTELRLTAPAEAEKAGQLVLTLSDGNETVGTVTLIVRALATMPF